jgi:hypothetical protein
MYGRIESEHCKRVLLLLSHQWPFVHFQQHQKPYEAFEKSVPAQILLIIGFALLGIDRILHFSKRNNFPLTAPVPFYLIFISD